MQHRLYGYSEYGGFSAQFLTGLSNEHREIFTNVSHNLTLDEATSIFENKNYEDPPMRGRQSFNPFKKLGFVRLENNILRLTDLGEHFLFDQYDLAEIFLRSFIKWGSSGFRMGKSQAIVKNVVQAYFFTEIFK